MGVRLKRVGLVCGMVLASLNIWTGAPLVGLVVGSRVAGDRPITMLAVFVTVMAIAAVAFALIRLLAVLGAHHDALTGHQASVRRHTPWLRSMSGERVHGVPGVRARLTALEYVLVGSVVLAVVAFEIWFFFFSGSPFDGRTGR